MGESRRWYLTKSEDGKDAPTGLEKSAVDTITMMARVADRPLDSAVSLPPALCEACVCLMLGT